MIRWRRTPSVILRLWSSCSSSSFCPPELNQVVVSLSLLAHLVGGLAATPVVPPDELAGAVDEVCDVGHDLLATLGLDGRVQQKCEVVDVLFRSPYSAADGSNVGRTFLAGDPTRCMGRNLIRRIRWGNVALAAAGIGWRSRSAWRGRSRPTTPPALPDDVPRPLVAQEPDPTLSAPTPTPRPPRKSDKSEKEPRVKPRAPRGLAAAGRRARAAKARGGGRHAAARRAGGRASAGRGGDAAPRRAARRRRRRHRPSRRAGRSAPAPRPRGEFGFEG